MSTTDIETPWRGDQGDGPQPSAEASKSGGNHSKTVPELLARTRRRFLNLCESDIQVYVDHGDDREEVEQVLWGWVQSRRPTQSVPLRRIDRELIRRYYQASLEVCREARDEGLLGPRPAWLDLSDDELKARTYARFHAAVDARMGRVKPEPALEQQLTDGDREFLDALRTVDPQAYELFRGQWDRRRYKSQSEADFALLGKLRRYGCDRQRLRRLFLASGLCRPKTRSRRGRSDYLGFTIGKLLAKEARS